MDEKELLQAIMDSQLGSPGQDGEEAWTSSEISDMSGVHVARIRKTLGKLVSSDYVEVVWVRRDDLRTPLTGMQSKRPGYRLTKEGKAAIKDLSA